MHELLLRYKMPENLNHHREIQVFRDRVISMAIQIQAKAEKVFSLSTNNVVWEVREFHQSRGMPDFYVTGWITDNYDEKKDDVLEAQLEILALMRRLTFRGETVACWIQRVKGKWGEANGLMEKPPAN